MLALQTVAFSQATDPGSPSSKKDAAAAVDPLPNYPHPPDEPRSLFTQSKPIAVLPPLPGPYFEQDPLLDPPQFPATGCFADAEIGFFASHVKNHLVNAVQIGNNTPDIVQLPSASLDWTVSPRFEVGYRLPSGFGEFVMGYRFLVTEGSTNTIGLDGFANLKSRLDMNVFDWDYASREYSLWPNCEMKWRVGVRLAYVYFDSQSIEPIGLAAAGSGIFEQGESNSFVGFGPHAGVELSHHFGDTGLSLTGRVDFASLLGRIRQGFFEQSTTFNDGETRNSGSQGVPTVNVQAGLSWQPPQCKGVSFFLGYQYEHWWSIGQLGDSSAEVTDQGIFIRAAYNF
jgi:hypothetical protein